MKIFIEPIDRNKNPGAWYKFHHFLAQALLESDHTSTTAEAADVVIVHVLNDKLPGKHDPRKLIILDWSDHNLFIENNCLAYFKKSWANCSFQNGIYIKSNPTTKKNQYPLQEMALPSYFLDKTKTRKLACTLRDSGRGDIPNRKLVLDMIKKMNLQDAHIGALHSKKFGKASWIEGQPRGHIEYLEFIAETKIIVTCGPSVWEGDSRLWESLASGACVVSDKICANMGFNPIHGEHCFYYEMDKLTELQSLLEYLLDKEELCRNIGEAGRRLVEERHSPKHRLEQIISVVK